MDILQSAVTQYLPAEVEISAMLKFLLILGAGALILGTLARMLLGKNSSLNRCTSSAMGILFIYVMTIVIYTFQPWDLEKLLSELPFVQFSGDRMILLPFRDAELYDICSQILSMVILAFLYNLLDSFVPRGENVLSWYLLRLVTILLSMLVHYLVQGAFNTYLPDVLVTYAPTILLIVLIVTLTLGLLKLVLGVFLTVVNPIIGAIYAFFFSTKLGKHLTRAVLTTLLLCILVLVLEYTGYNVISIRMAALPSYLPLIAALLVLWYLLGHVL